MCLFELWFSLGMCPVVGLLGHYGNTIFSFLRNLHSVLHSGCINLHSHQQCIRVSSFSISMSALIFCFCFFNSHPNGCEWCFTVVLICIFLMIYDVEHIFMCCWPFVCLFWRNVYSCPYSCPSLIFKLGFCC